MSTVMNADTIHDIDALTEHKPLFGGEGVAGQLKDLVARISSDRGMGPVMTPRLPAPISQHHDTGRLVPLVQVVVAGAGNPGPSTSPQTPVEYFQDDTPTRIVTNPVAFAGREGDAVITVPLFDEAATLILTGQSSADETGSANSTPVKAVGTDVIESADDTPVSLAEAERFNDDDTEARLIAVHDAPTQILTSACEKSGPILAAAEAFARSLDQAPSDAISGDGGQPTLLLFAPSPSPAKEATYSWRDAIPACEGEPASLPKLAFVSETEETDGDAWTRDPWALETDDTPIAFEVRHLLDADVRPVDLVPDFVPRRSMAARLKRLVATSSRRVFNRRGGTGRLWAAGLGAAQTSRRTVFGTSTAAARMLAPVTALTARRALVVRCGAAVLVAASVLFSAYALDLTGTSKIETWEEVQSAVNTLNAAAPIDVNASVTLERVSADANSRTMTYHLTGAVESIDDNIFDPAQMKDREIANGCGSYRPYLAGIVEQLRFVYSARDGSTGVFTILPEDCGIKS